MAKRISMSQFKSSIRQAERAINNYNRAVRKYNSDVKRAVSTYNTEVRRYNSTVRHNRQIIQRELAKLNSASRSPQYHVYRTTIATMQHHYNNVISIYDDGFPVTPDQEHILNIIEQEQAHSLITANAVLNDTVCDETGTDVEISEKLGAISIDLMNRWKGAVFSINPQNPDAARHFCTSARELFTEFIEMMAPDHSVFEFNPHAEKTERGNATRREKIKYMMRNTDMDDCIAEFADADISNIVELFSVLSNATHGAAGKYEFQKLVQVKHRVERGVNFLCTLCA